MGSGYRLDRTIWGVWLLESYNDNFRTVSGGAEKSSPSLFSLLYKLGIRLSCGSVLNSPSAHFFNNDLSFSTTFGCDLASSFLNSPSKSLDDISRWNVFPQLLAHASRSCKSREKKKRIINDSIDDCLFRHWSISFLYCDDDQPL